MRATLKPELDKAQLNALSMTSYYLSGMLYLSVAVAASLAFLAEILILQKTVKKVEIGEED